MEITTDLVKNLANLSRLNFTDSEIEFFKAEFTKTLEHIDEIQSINAEVIDTLEGLDAKTDLREDEIKASLSQEDVLKNAPKAKQGMFAVAKIIE
ncbi:MAG: Asp-tRNA(Asn)/Glu-tRNA(Gln) amidotransferase subunit GatC [Clostridia bacterium]|nr:Asp-tRNA(Asn)/Glu-tRNA(Gln) amidotransferase subunit GatC [Clostridia bacterium]